MAENHIRAALEADFQQRLAIEPNPIEANEVKKMGENPELVKINNSIFAREHEGTSKD